MEGSGGRVLAYGVLTDAASFECVDCGHRLEHAHGRLPPCPRYRDSTHSRAAWRYGGDREARGEPDGDG
jgi:hypothetical protein